MCGLLWTKTSEGCQPREDAQDFGSLPGKLSEIFSEAKLIQGVFPGIDVVNNLKRALIVATLSPKSDSLLVDAVRIRCKLQQEQNFSGVYWPLVGREILWAARLTNW